MFTRRQLLKRTLQASAAGLWSGYPAAGAAAQPELVVNDIHSQLNPTRVQRVEKPTSIELLQAAIKRAADQQRPISICGGRHAMGGQQFGKDTALIDTTGMQRVLEFDATKGEIEAEAGIQWPALIEYLIKKQRGTLRATGESRLSLRERTSFRGAKGDDTWGIIQKQTGADRLCLGGSLSANVHGRGLRLKPIIGDVAAFTLIDAAGKVRRCSRQENAELFNLAIGGYGLFGVIASVRLRLSPRKKLRRVVEVSDVDELMPTFEKRIADGFLYGDFQYSTDRDSPGFLRKGVFSCYEPVAIETPILAGQRELGLDQWKELLYLAHVDKARAFEMYSHHYLATSGQIYWSDTHQLSAYVDDYHQPLSRRLGSREAATEMITEIYVPRESLTRFLAEVRQDFLQNGAELIYGTIRLIEKDDESFLAWAREPFACIIFNLHTEHTPMGIEKVQQQFRQLIDRAIQHGGSFYLTYHRWAARRQVEVCYPQFVEFLRLKRRHDPQHGFQSDWWRHYEAMFAERR